jgi:large subunit ribosomal protein L4
MAKVSVYNLDRKQIGEVDLSDEVFSAEVNEGLMYDVLKAQLASRRSGTSNSKARAEVSGSTRKLIRQKGTGGARHGASRAPIMVGGGKSHGPKPHSWAYEPPRKMRAGAMRSALSLKLKEGNLTIVDAFELPEVKTKRIAGVLKTLGTSPTSLVVDAKGNDKLRLSIRNMAGSQYLPPEGVNLYDVLRHEHLIITKQAAVALADRFRKG